MNRDYLLGRLKQFNGKIKEQWCELHGDQPGVVAAKRYQIASRTQAQCGIVQHQATQQLRSFKSRYCAWRLTASIVPAKSQRAVSDQAEFARRRSASGYVLIKAYTEMPHA